MSWSHQFDEDVAIDYGVSPAVMIAAIQRWIRKNKANEKNQHEGRTWTFNSIRAWSELFPFWTEKQIRLILGKLIEAKVLMTANLNKNSYDQTLWYAFVDEGKWLSCDAQKGTSICPKGQMTFAQKGEPIPPLNNLKIPPVSTPAAANRGKPRLPPIVYDWEQFLFEGISDHEVARWAEVYPACDIEEEIGKAAMWLKANPKNRKKNYRRFLTNWLTRQQEKGGSHRWSSAR